MLYLFRILARRCSGGGAPRDQVGPRWGFGSRVTPSEVRLASVRGLLGHRGGCPSYHRLPEEDGRFQGFSGRSQGPPLCLIRESRDPDEVHQVGPVILVS